MDSKKKELHHLSAPISPNYIRLNNSNADSLFDDYYSPPPPAYQPNSSQSNLQFDAYLNKNQFYQPTPAPQTVIVHRQPAKLNDSCCWGCLAALCLCFGAKECC